VALSEWGLTPDYVNQEWTPEILWLMFYERKDNIERIEEYRRRQLGHEPEEDRRVVSDTELFKKMKISTRG
jgi:hypothetical protein